MQNIKKSDNNNKFKILAPTQNDGFELPNILYSISDIQNYFETISTILKDMERKLIFHKQKQNNV